MAREVPATILEVELVQEQAGALAQAGEALTAAISRLNAAAQDDRRPALVQAAAQALWRLSVVREAIGLRDSGMLVRDYQVPAEVVRVAGLASPLHPRLRR